MSTDPNTVISYNENAEAYNAHVNDPSDSIYHAYYEKPAMRAELPDLHGLSVISIGCGSGVDAQYLKDAGAERVVGIDISSGMIAVAQRDHPGIEFSVMDMEKLDFPNETFHVAYSSLAIHYLDDWTQALKEAHRILKPSGLYILSAAHPLDQAWERQQVEMQITKALGLTRNKSNGSYEIHGDYMAAESQGTERIQGGLVGLDVVTYRQTFAKIVSFIVDSGFTIEKFVEPLPTQQMQEIDPYHYELLTKIPGFGIWKLRK